MISKISVLQLPTFHSIIQLNIISIRLVNMNVNTKNKIMAKSRLGINLALTAFMFPRNEKVLLQNSHSNGLS